MAFLEDGYRTLVTFELEPTIRLLEVSVTPFGLEGGDQIEQTTMRNNLWRTFAPQFLITATEMSGVFAYDPIILADLLGMLNVNQIIACTHSDGSAWTFWGYLRNFILNENSIGSRPTGNAIIVPTNRDASGVENTPTYTAP